MTRDQHPHIGHVAGLVYKRLEKEGKPMSLLELTLALRVWPREVALALGWLSREDKIRLWKNKAALMAELKKD